MPLSILVVDDDKVTADIHVALLRAAGYEVAVAYDAMQGFRIANRDRPALVVLDMQMPGGGGLKMLERLAHSSRTHRVVILVVSGSTEPGLEDYVRKRGAGGFLQKPATKEALVGTVAKLLAESPPAPEQDQNRT